MRHISSKATKSPLVSVVIPVFNAAKYLPEALDSLLSQVYANLEFIAVNDASTDSSLSILNAYSKLDKRLKVYSNPKNLKISRTLNFAISKAKGKYIARMDADDIALPGRIEKQVAFLQAHPSVVIVGGQCKTIDINSKNIGRKLFPIKHEAIKEGLFTGNPIQHPSAIINRSLLPENFSWYNPTLPPAEDLDLFFRLGKYGQYANLPVFVLKYRQHLGSETFKNPVYTFSLTQRVRRLAVKKYGYRPSLKARMVNQLQIATINLLPETLIYPVYLLVRGIKSPLQLVWDQLSKIQTPRLMLNLNRGQKHH